MELEILRLIYDYSCSGKLVDLKFIDKIVDIVVTNRGLSHYVRNIKLTDKLDKDDYKVACAGYNSLNNNILVDYESVRIVLDNLTYYDCLFEGIEPIMFKNLTITQILLHELEHAYQSKQADDKFDNSIEAKLIRASLVLEQVIKNPKLLTRLLDEKVNEQEFIIYILHNRELYKKYYKMNPTERLAQIKSFKSIVKSIEPIKKYIPNLYEFNNASLWEEMIKGYQESWSEGSCPTQVYLNATRQSDMWSGFDFYSQSTDSLIKNVSKHYSLEKRLSFGLPVTNREYSSIEDYLYTTNKFNI